MASRQEGRSSRASPEAPMPPLPVGLRAERPLAGIFFKDQLTDDRYIFEAFSTDPPPRHPDPSFSPIPNRFTICSSSNGLLLCYDFTDNTYYVLNPFIPDAHRRIPEPPRSHRDCHIAVLSVHLLGNFFFDIICAFEEEAGKYSFDWYFSRSGRWQQELSLLDISPSSRIMESSGIGDDVGSALWLTVDHKAVVRFDTLFSSASRVDIPEVLHAAEKMQLGKLNDNDIGIVVSRGTSLWVYTFEPETRRFSFYGHLDDFTRFEFFNQMKWMGKLELRVLLRFHNDVPIWVGHELMLWNLSNRDHEPNAHVKYQQLHAWEFVPPADSDTVPYEFSPVLPSHFLEEGGEEVTGPLEQGGEEDHDEQRIVEEEEDEDKEGDSRQYDDPQEERRELKRRD